MKRKSQAATLAATLITIGSLAGVANAAITVNIQGESGSSLVSVSVSGSGTWQSGNTGSLIGWGSGWSSDLISDTVQSDSGLNLGDGAPLTSGLITLINSATTVNVHSLNFDSDGTGTEDDFALFFSPTITVTTGESYSISGSGTFDLDAMESGATFDDLVIGTHTNDTGFTPVILNVSAVPEPSSTALLGLGALGLLVRRKRNS